MSKTCDSCKEVFPLADMVDPGYCAHSIREDAVRQEAELTALRELEKAARKMFETGYVNELRDALEKLERVRRRDK